MKKLGVIGGMGPLATAYFMELVTLFTEAECDAQNIEMEILSVPSIPDRTQYILGLNDMSPVPKIVELRDKLTADGCEVIAIPCNTAVFFKNEYTLDCDALILNPIEETALKLNKIGVKKAGVMATDGTMQATLFTKEFAKFGIEPIESDEEHQKIIMDMIYKYVKAGKSIPESLIKECEAHLRDKGAEIIVLGCTELSMLKKDGQVKEGFLDTLEVLAEASVVACGAGFRSNI